MKKLYLLLIISLFQGDIFAQTECGFDLYRDKASEINTDNLIRNALQNYTADANRDAVIIPVVFHVIYSGTAGSIADVEITNAISELNLRFSNTGIFNHVTGHTVNIQFCLATVDPFGNATTGINRVENGTYAFLNDGVDLELKSLSRWAPLLYLNVWTVADIINPLVGGYANYPNYAGYAFDGIVMESALINNTEVLAHEVGHYLSLYHTFEGGCLNNDCALEGDQICDTPPDNSNFFGTCISNSCNTDADDPSPQNPFTSDVDELPNYMDYTACQVSFTQDQATRMEVAFATFRSDLNLSNGCGSNPGGPIPTATISIDSAALCTGTIRFNAIGDDIMFATWDFNNDGLYESVGSQIDYAYQSSGFKTVHLFVSGFGGSDTTSATFYVRVGNTPYFPMIYPSSGIAIDPFLNRPFACSNDTLEILTNGSFQNYTWSDGSSSSSLTFVTEQGFEISLTAIDSLGREWKSCKAIEAEITPDYSLSLNVSDTVGCGNYIHLIFNPIPYYNIPNNTWFKNGIAIAQNQWNFAEGSWNTGLNEFYVDNISPIGCHTSTDTISYFVPEVETPLISQSNDTLFLSHDCLNVNWFLDGQVILTAPNDSFYVFTELGCYHAWCQQCGNFTTDDFCVTPLNTQNVQPEKWMLFPNPSTGVVKINSFINELNAELIVSVYSIDGKCIKQQSLVNNEFDLSGHRGLYQVILRNSASNEILLKSKIIIE
jgi:PKD repeat protein